MNIKSVPKSKLKLLASLAIVTILVVPMLSVFVSAQIHDSDWYSFTDGVLSSDYYALYPYEKNSLSVGFSQFGELMAYDVDTGIGLGLQYPGYEQVGTYDQRLGGSRDPWANEGISVQYWLNGWFLDARYTHRTLGDRHVWAMAMFADMTSHGNDWLNYHTNPYGAPYGGRKCSAYAMSEPLTVIYDGPRRYVAQAVTHIYDKDITTWPLLDVIITIDFNKVKKEVIVFKDIKLTIDSKILETPVDVQFSNRQEWDLGPSPDWKSYAHFWHQELETCYGQEWHVVDRIVREYKNVSIATAGQTIIQLPQDIDPLGPDYVFPVLFQSEYVYINDVWKDPELDYTMNYANGRITLKQGLKAGDVIVVYYKLNKLDCWLGDEDYELLHSYDLVQIISSDKKYVGFAAYWPTLSDYTPDGWGRALEPLYAVDDEDMLPFSSEPDIPFTIGEWDFLLDYTTEFPTWKVPEFRGVTVYGLVNLHDAQDEHFVAGGGGVCVIDREVCYQLDEVFNPWDLVSAVHKDTKRWVEFYTVPSGLTVTIGDPYAKIPRIPVRVVSDYEWWGYCEFAERIVDLTADKLLKRGTDYSIYMNPIGTATIYFKSDYNGHVVKVLYSTDTYTYDEKDFNYQLGPVMSSVYVDGEDGSGSWSAYATESWMDLLGATHIFYWEDDGWLRDYSQLDKPLNRTFISTDNCDVEAEFKTVPGAEGYSYIDSDEIRYEHVYTEVGDTPINLTLKVNGWIDFDYTIVAPEKVYLQGYYEIEGYFWRNLTSIYYNNGTNWLHWWELTLTWSWTITFTEWHGGRYEWVVVGMHSRAVDSAGASMVSAAFKNKQVEIGLGGLDMQDTMWGPNVPNLLTDMGYLSAYRPGAPAWTDYYDTMGRLALKDHWCWTGTTPYTAAAPISSSNIITVGGGPANLVTEYFNEFTSAIMIYGSSMLSDVYMDTILAVPCWSMNNYGAGYAVIATYKDLNGTVGFLVYGYTADDTYYVCKWLFSQNEMGDLYGMQILQAINDHVTALILKIDYTKHPVSVSIVELLGTISEKWPCVDP